MARQLRLEFEGAFYHIQGRFKGIIVDKDEYLVTLSRYIHLNPETITIGVRSTLLTGFD